MTTVPIKRHMKIFCSAFIIVILFVFFRYQSRPQHVSEGIQINVKDVKVVNDWILPPDHPYIPFLGINSTHELSTEVLRFLSVSRFRSFPHRYDQMFMELLTEFDRIWRQKLGRSYFIFGGTLLGAVRHGSWLPYDDDLDVVVDIKFRRTIFDVFKGSSLHVFDPHSNGLMLYFNNPRTLKPIWPFLDIFFYDQQKDGTANFIRGFYNRKLFSREIFPTIWLPFNGYMLPAPRCPQKILRRLYGSPLKTCCVYAHNHRTDSNTGSACIECARLAAIFPYLKWSRINDTHAQRFKSFPSPLHNDRSVTWQQGEILKFPKC